MLRQRAQVDEAMRRISLEAHRMSVLVGDMLRLARLDQHPSPDSEPVDLTRLAADCAERARSADPHRTWRAEIEPGLVVTGDAEMLRRAIDNLLANVGTHTPAGTAATVTAARRGATVTVSVSDDGPGVPAAQLPRIFDRFCRGDAPARRPGSGLGLAIVAAIAAAHDGAATASPAGARGLCVSLALPATVNGGGQLPAAGGRRSCSAASSGMPRVGPLHG